MKAVLDNLSGRGNLALAIKMSAVRHLFVSSLVFLGVWFGLTRQSMADTNVDVDLGIATSDLSLGDGLVWNLPLAIAVWMVFEGGLVLALLAWRKLRRTRRSEFAGSVADPA